MSRIYVFGLLTSLLIGLASGAPIRVKRADVEPVRLGWTGLKQGTTITPSADEDGDFGKAFYIAASTDLAQTLAGSGTHVCEITADPTAWSEIPKNWATASHVKGARPLTPPAGDPAATGGNQTQPDSTETVFPGAVLFGLRSASASDDTPQERAEPPTKETKPWQMAVREAELEKLSLKGTCYPKEDAKVKAGQALDYPKLSKKWGIKGKPEADSTPDSTP